LGNKDPFLHAHIIPRYDWESAEFKPLSTWRYPDETWSDPQHLFSREKHGALRDAIKQYITNI
jgi:diadenosine tetraphosphate (Ap4A) HIT family hydrolase